MSPRSATVLLVDDDLVVLELLETCLQQEGVAFLFARSGAEALTTSRTQSVDLVLLDIGLPDMSGFAVLEQLKGDPATASIPVLALTAHGNEDEVIRGFELGAADYVTKPFTIGVLQARVGAALRTTWLWKDLVRARVDAERAARVKSTFLASMSHDMHTPLNGIIAVTDMLLQSGLQGDQAALANTIRISSERLLTVTQSALDMLALEAGELQLEAVPYSMHSVIEQTLELWQEVAAERKVRLSMGIAARMPVRVVGDQGRLRLILNQLLGALLRTAGQGEIVVRVATPHVDERLTVPASADAKCPVFFTTEATLAESNIDDLVFALADPESRLGSHKGSGTDVGIALCHKLVEFMGGRFWARKEGHTRVLCGFTLPLTVAGTEEPAPGLQAPGQPAAAAQQSALSGLAIDKDLAARCPARILLVDDDAINRKIAARIFAKMGYQVELAAHANEAVAAIRQKTFDLVFTDIQMPGISGVEATKLYREADKAAGHARPRPLHIVATTASALGGDREKYLAVGMDDYVAKPVRPATLQGVIEAWSQRRAAPAPTAPAPAPVPPSPQAEAEPESGEPLVDMERLNDFTSGDPVLLSDTVSLYLGDAGRRLEALRAAVTSNDAQRVRQVAHAMVGATATIGAATLVPFLQKLEECGRSANLALAPKTLEAAEKEFSRVRQFLLKVVASTG